MTAEAIVDGGRSALILGATGLVGSHCLTLLLADRRYSTVHAVTRRPLAFRNSRFVQHVIAFGDFAAHPEVFRHDDIFCCLGTTIRKGGSREEFWKVDVEYPAVAAQLACDAGADQFLVVSALGADPESRIFYNRAKGEMEARVRRVPLKAIWILRPALLLGKREEVRLGERVAESLLRPILPLLRGPLRHFRPVDARTVAAALVALAGQDGTGGIVESEEIEQVAAVRS